jgi:hypothetical protein
MASPISVRSDAQRPIVFLKKGVASEPPMTCMTVFKNTVKKHGSRMALKNEVSTYTWQEYYEETIQFGKGTMPAFPLLLIFSILSRSPINSPDDFNLISTLLTILPLLQH